ncbi:hypothetical protein ACRE_068470 [Hapsidospora chrysogenum ATCC 11550]|uniref:Uncharacterized protein n=1 Tax=Hapsidospora chrysogenum (strain ATCC 11550 / CBS 779.69 / DSM 880 / IAM 14645 / JCM 23072 / IMI 49137) TaxID=857340 RepID=A0A086SZ66_HAPC1|nr:hypothetical protein ACRE_068470 [Hapsidospora chrysogenum ATCC 11550]
MPTEPPHTRERRSHDASSTNVRCESIVISLDLGVSSTSPQRIHLLPPSSGHGCQPPTNSSGALNHDRTTAASIMSFIQAPPTHYPSSQESTVEIFRARNYSLNEPPAYGAERAPPRYQEETAAEIGEHDGDSPEARAKARRIRYTRILSSVFIVTTVALIVAGVVGKISATQGGESWLGGGNQGQTESSTADQEAATSTPTVEPTETIGFLPLMTVEAVDDVENIKEENDILEELVQIESTVGTAKGERPNCGASFRESEVSLHGGHQLEEVSAYLDCLAWQTSVKEEEEKDRRWASSGDDGVERRTSWRRIQ